jgi:hypothetical protein
VICGNRPSHALNRFTLERVKVVELIYNAVKLKKNELAEVFAEKFVPKTLLDLFTYHPSHSFMHYVVCSIFLEALKSKNAALIRAVRWLSVISQ